MLLSIGTKTWTSSVINTKLIIKTLIQFKHKCQTLQIIVKWEKYNKKYPSNENGFK